MYLLAVIVDEQSRSADSASEAELQQQSAGDERRFRTPMSY